MLLLGTTLAYQQSFQISRKRAPLHVQFLLNKLPKTSFPTPLYSSFSSSYEIDDSGDEEELRTSKTTTAMNVNGDLDVKAPKMGDLNTRAKILKDVGLDGKLLQVSNFSNKRAITSTDIFCNREINFGNLAAIGFDMDYTLAQYKQPAFDKLAFDGAKNKLVNKLGYPKEVLDIEYDHELWIRGLIIDIQKGNFLKIDRHKYVRVAYHGLRRISSRNRKLLYSRTFNKVPSFSEKHFINMDTLFQHVDAHLFANIIEMKDGGKHEFLDSKTYEDIYREIRQSVDLCHRDGVIKDVVAMNPEKYIVTDDSLLPMLKKIRASGIKLFLLTNSYWEYTSVAMNFLFHKKNVDEETKLKNEWIDLFDSVIVGSCKPAFLVDPYLNLYRVQTETGSLLNTDGVYEIEALGKNGAQKFLSQGKVFQGGNWMHLQAMLETKAGEEILYVGDHLYADVLRSKRTLGWRTALIVPELEKEMETFFKNKHVAKQISEIRSLRDEMSSYADALRRDTPVINEEVEQILKDLEYDDNILKERLSDIVYDYHSKFHPVWGQMFYAGYQDSRFAFYVQNYACVYMSKASNFGMISMDRSLRTAGEMLPHDKLLSEVSSSFTSDESQM